MRLRVIAGVMMEPHLAVAERADRFAVLDDVGHHHERRVVFAAGGAAVGRAAADVHLAEIAGGAELVLFRQVLVAKHDDHVFIERLVDGRDVGVAERLPQIDPVIAAPSAGDSGSTEIGMVFLLGARRSVRRRGASTASVGMQSLVAGSLVPWRRLARQRRLRDDAASHPCTCGVPHGGRARGLHSGRKGRSGGRFLCQAAL